MSKKVLIILMIAALVLLGVAGAFALRNGGKNEESSLLESSGESSAVPEVVVMQSEFPAAVSLAVPPGFSQTSSDYYEKYFIKDDASIIVTSEQFTIKGITLNEYVEQMKEKYGEAVEEYNEISDERLEVNGLDCAILEFHYAIAGNGQRLNMHSVVGAFVKNDTAYIVTCKSHEETYGSYGADFREAIASVQIADDRAQSQTQPAETTAQISPESP